MAQVLRAEIERDKNASFWADLAKNFGFTVFGWLMGEASAWWRGRRRARAGSQKEV